MSNYGALAVLAELRTHEARLRTARTYSLLIALETFPAGADGWREVGAELLCESAGLAQSTFRQARGELIGAKLIEYRPGARRGERSRWRITFRVEEPPGKGAAQSGTLRKGAAQSGASTTLKGGHTRPGKGAGPGPERVPDPNRAVAASPGTLTSPNAAPEPDSGRSTALEPSALGSSALSARARDPRTLLLGLGADETEIELIAASIEADPDIRDPWVYVLTVIGNGDGPAWLDRKRRDLAYDDPPRPPKPPWCGECDEQTRLVDRDGDHPARCIRCHPLSVQPTGAEPGSSIWLKPWCGQCDGPDTRWAEVEEPGGAMRLERCPDCGMRR